MMTETKALEIAAAEAALEKARNERAAAEAMRLRYPAGTLLGMAADRLHAEASRQALVAWYRHEALTRRGEARRTALARLAEMGVQ